MKCDCPSGWVYQTVREPVANDTVAPIRQMRASSFGGFVGRGATYALREAFDRENSKIRQRARSFGMPRSVMFENFRLEMVNLPETKLRVRHGGSGPPLLLLHGHPRTHTTWYKVAPILAEHFTVICPDLRGFGQSGKPDDPYDYEASSKRAKARDCVALMDHFGFNKFSLAGHDRGSYTAFRTAMDHPARVAKLAILDGVPILEALEHCNARFATQWWHWFFFAQHDKPEQAISADPLRWYGGTEDLMGKENYADFRLAVQDHSTIQGMLGDYRAGVRIDHLHDREDRNSGRKLQCPLRVLWSLRDDLEDLYNDVLAIWQPWAELPVSGLGIDSGHHMAEEAPLEVARELKSFFLA